MKLAARLTNLKSLQNGQTLIETIVAIFVLVTALSAGVGLAIYALTTSNKNFNEITATSLAREGVEMVRDMRDSNWLASYAKGGSPWALASCADIGGRLCYPSATSAIPSYNAYSLGAGTYRLQFTYATRSWSLQQSPGNYDLYQQADGTYTHTAVSGGSSIYARMIKLSNNTAAPYTNQNSNWELIVKSIVAWRGKGCPDFVSSQDLENLVTPCKVMLEEHLTNWKDYE